MSTEQINKPSFATHDAAEALQIAISYLGQKEEPAGSNGGPFVDKCLKLVGLGTGYYWCMAFVYRCFHEAGIVIPRTAGVMDCWRKASESSKILKKSTHHSAIKPGMIFIMDYGKGKGHTGIVESISVDDKGAVTLNTVEGNTDANGSRTGGMVCRQKRRWSDAKLIGFVSM